MPHLFKLSVFTTGLAFQDSAKQAAGELVSHIYSAREIHNVLSIYVYGSSFGSRDSESLSDLKCFKPDQT